MKKAPALFAVAIVAILSAGCSHTHIFNDATCTEPKTCTECGQTEGEALGHSFSKATCTEPKTCTECGQTEGEALGHSFSKATCTKPKTCTECGQTEGKALGHTATIGKCTRCGSKNGWTEFTEIIDVYFDATDHFDSATDYIIYANNTSSLASRISYCQKSYDELNKYCNKMNKAARLAKQYPELSKLSGLLSKVGNMNLTYPADKNSAIAFTDEVLDMLDYIESIATEVQSIFDSIK